MAEQTVGVVNSVGAKRGTQREYETVIILKPAAGKRDILDLVERMQKVFGELNATLLKIDNWGLRTLSFPIKGQRRGIYLYWRFVGGSDVVAEFERRLRIADLVVRYYTVKVDEDVVPDARPSEVNDELLDAVSESGADPLDIAREEAERAAAERAAEEAARAAEEAAAAAAAAEAQAAEEGGEKTEEGADQ